MQYDNMKRLLLYSTVLLLPVIGCNDSPSNFSSDSPDYRAAYFTDALDSMYVIKLTGSENGSHIKFAYRGVSVDWIPNSSSLIYSERTEKAINNVWKYDCQTRSGQLLFTFMDAGISELRVSPDGKYVACTKYLNESTGRQVSIFDINGATFRSITPSNEPSIFLCWAPDGKSILYRKNQFETGSNSTLWSIDINTSQKSLLSDTSYHVGYASYSPDGNQIVHSVYDTGTNNSTLCIMSSNGENKRYITPFSTSVTSPKWSPDGKSIAFIKNDQFHVMRVHLLNVIDMSVQQISTTPGVHFYVRWVDNNVLAYYDNGVTNLCLVSKEGTNTRQLTNITSLQAGSIFYYSISSLQF